MRDQALVLLLIRMVGTLKAHGKRIKGMEEVLRSFLMEILTMVSINLVKFQVKAFIHG